MERIRNRLTGIWHMRIAEKQISLLGFDSAVSIMEQKLANGNVDLVKILTAITVPTGIAIRSIYLKSCKFQFRIKFRRFSNSAFVHNDKLMNSKVDNEYQFMNYISCIKKAG